MAEQYEDEYREYETFTMETKDGDTVELAVMDTFEKDGIAYVAAALVEGDTISDDGVFLFRAEGQGEETEYVKIEDEAEYEQVSDFYMSRS